MPVNYRQANLRVGYSTSNLRISREVKETKRKRIRHMIAGQNEAHTGEQLNNIKASENHIPAAEYS